MLLLVDCSNCKTPLQLPPGAPSIRCAICGAITRIAEPRSLPHPPPPPHAYYPPPPPHPPQQPPHPPPPYYRAPSHSGSVGPTTGRKKALICGISYKYSRHELKGCINDAKCMKYLLINRFKFPESDILMLTGLVEFW